MLMGACMDPDRYSAEQSAKATQKLLSTLEVPNYCVLLLLWYVIDMSL